MSDGDTPSEIFESAFNVPNEVSLVCGDEWNYDTAQTYLLFKGNKDHKFNGVWNSTDDLASNSGLKTRGEDKSPWLGAKMSMSANGQNMIDSKGASNEALKITEFYFAKSEDDSKIKFGDGNPKGSHCSDA